MKELSTLIDKELSFDPIAEMERIAGKSYKEDESIVWASMALAQENGRRKEELLKLNDDTFWGITIPEFMRLLSRLGFETLLTDDLDEGNKFRVCWNPDGLLIKFDSYWGDKSINGGEVRGYVQFDDIEKMWDALQKCSHGGIKGRDDVRNFSYDLREGLRNKLTSIRGAGKILPKWPEKPYFSLTSYMDWQDTDGYDDPKPKKAHEERMKRLPLDIQDNLMGRCWEEDQTAHKSP